MNFKEDVLPHLIATIVFVVVTVFFYNPLVFSGKSLNQHDITQGLAASQEIINHRLQTGEEALWTNSIFGGMPAYLINMNWSGDLMLHLQHFFSLWLPSAAAVMLICCLTFYVLLLTFGVRPWLAIAGALAFSLGSFNIISVEAGHMWKMWAIAYMPLVLAGVHLAFRKRYLLGLAVMALGLALELRSNHLQITYYLLLLLLVYGGVHLAYAIKDRELPGLIKPLGYLVAGALLALLCNTGKIWSVYEYGQYSTRGPSELTSNDQQGGAGLDQDYAFRWSNGIMEPITLLIPEFFGGPSMSSLPDDSNLGKALRANGQPPVQARQYLQQVATYWGDQPFVAGPSYAGAVVIFLFVLGLLTIDPRHRLWLVIAIVLSMVLSWGSNFEAFNSLMFDYFPGYNKFRSVSMTLVIALVCIPLAGFMGLERLLQGSDPNTKRQLMRALYITGGILLVALLYSFIGSFRGGNDTQLFAQVPPWYAEALKADRASLLRSDTIRSLVLVVLCWVALFYHQRGKLSLNLLYAVIILLVTIDLWGVDKRYLTDEDFVTSRQSNIAVTAADQQILQDPNINYRVLSILKSPWNDAETTSYHKSVGGYHGAKMQRYAEVIEGCLDAEFRELLQQLQSGTSPSAHPVLNMLNTRYLIAGSEAESAVRIPYAQGNAWFVPQIQLVNSADEEFNALCDLNIGSQALVDQSKFNIGNTTYSASGSLELEEYQPNYLRYRSQNQGDGFAVFSEIYYPKGWKATIDGSPVDILRANYILRALEIPSGSHVIEFRFAPAAYFMGNTIMMISSALVILLVLAVFFMELKKFLGRTSSTAHDEIIN